MNEQQRQFPQSTLDGVCELINIILHLISRLAARSDKHTHRQGNWNWNWNWFLLVPFSGWLQRTLPSENVYDL